MQEEIDSAKACYKHFFNEIEKARKDKYTLDIKLL